QVPHECLYGLRRGMTVEADDQIIAVTAAGETANGGAFISHATAGDANLAYAAALVAYAQDILTADSVGDNGRGDIATVEINRIVGDDRVTIQVEQCRAAVLNKPDAVAIQVANLGRLIDMEIIVAT